jgi:hypothetical protein
MSNDPIITIQDETVPSDSLTPVQKQILADTNPAKEYLLKNGRKVSFKKPEGIISLKLARIMGQDSMNPALNLYYRMAFHIHALDGKVVRPPTSEIEIEAIIGRLEGEDTFAEVFAVFMDWAGITPEDLAGDPPAKK